MATVHNPDAPGPVIDPVDPIETPTEEETTNDSTTPSIDGTILPEDTGTVSEIKMEGSNLSISSNKLSGSVNGTIHRKGTGRLNAFNLDFKNLPISVAGGGGGSGNVEIMTVDAFWFVNESSETPVFVVVNCSMTFDEAYSVMESGKILMALLNITAKDSSTDAVYGIMHESIPCNSFYSNDVNSISGYTKAFMPGSFMELTVTWFSIDERPSIQRL